MQIQHIKLKAFLEPIDGLDLETFIHVFHEWIQQGRCKELLIDVADYRHVPNGPAVLLIAHEADYGVDRDGGRLGFHYSRKAAVDGGLDECVQQATNALLLACGMLEADRHFGEAVRFRRRDLELTVNDRALAPNTRETAAALAPRLASALGAALGQEGATVEHASAADPRELLRFHVRLAASMQIG